MWYAAALAVLASTLLTVGLYFMKREAERLPSLEGGWRLQAWGAFLRNRWWLLGLALQIAGYGLYLVALRAAPLSVISAALNGGIALFVVLSVVGLGEEPRPVEWLGVVLITGSLVMVSVLLSGAPSANTEAHGTVLFSSVVLGLAVVGIAVDQHPRRPIGLSVASGLLLGLGAVYAKSLADGDGLNGLLLSYLLLTVLANAVGFVLMQAAFQSGRGIVVMPLFSALSNLVPIIGGILVFGETLPTDEPGAVLRPLGFTLAILGAALLAGYGERPPALQPHSQVERARSP